MLENISLPSDPYFDKQWHLLNTGQAGGFDNNDIFAPEAWNRINLNSKCNCCSY